MGREPELVGEKIDWRVGPARGVKQVVERGGQLGGREAGKSFEVNRRK